MALDSKALRNDSIAFREVSFSISKTLNSWLVIGNFAIAGFVITQINNFNAITYDDLRPAIYILCGGGVLAYLSMFFASKATAYLALAASDIATLIEKEKEQDTNNIENIFKKNNIILFSRLSSICAGLSALSLVCGLVNLDLSIVSNGASAP